MNQLRLLIEPSRRKRSLWRALRAEERELMALLRQFWKPILAFALIILGGALIYTRLSPDDERMALGQAIYYMLDLMIFAVDPGDFPPDLPRQLFFFTMPVFGLTAMVSGVIGFGAALFNRSKRSAEWEAALASTYSNHVIVCGVGHLGTRVVRHLIEVNFDVVVIESNPQASGVEEIRTHNIPLIIKDASTSQTLIEAGVERADTLLVCTDDDIANLAVTIHARALNPKLRIVVRMFNDALAAQVHEKLGADAVYSGSMLAAPVFAGTATRTEVAHSYAIGGQTFNMARMEVCKGSTLAGKRIAEIEKPHELDVVLHISGARATAHPDANTIVQAGDELMIFAREDLLRETARQNRTPHC